MTTRATMRFAQYVFTVVALIALAYCAVVWLYARRYQQSETRYLNHELELKNRAAIPHAIPRAVAVPKEGGLVGRLEIPRIGLSVMVVEGVGSADLERAAGHIPGTALPSQRGNMGIAGHRDTFFRPLVAIHPGDTMTMGTFDGLYRYQVVFTKIVSPEDVSVLYPTGRDSLTLVTCYPFHFVGSAPLRFIVRAERSPA